MFLDLEERLAPAELAASVVRRESVDGRASAALRGPEAPVANAERRASEVSRANAASEVSAVFRALMGCRVCVACRARGDLEVSVGFRDLVASRD